MTPEQYMKDPRLPVLEREAKAFLAWPNTTPSPDEHMARHMAAFGLQMIDVTRQMTQRKDMIVCNEVIHETAEKHCNRWDRAMREHGISDDTVRDIFATLARYVETEDK